MAGEDDGLQQGGTRGSSNQGGPESSGEPEKDEALRINSRRDRGSRSTQGREEPAPGTEQDAGPQAPLPSGTVPEDYVGGAKPHKTRNDEEAGGASGVKNEVV
jgi:hypothetical protein